LSGPTLVWQYSETTTLRLEGVSTLAEAQSIGASVA
jgi:hypothetical protein